MKKKRQLELDKIVSFMPKSKEYISITEAYAAFGASRSTIYRLIYMKKISFIEPEKGIRLVCKGELMNLFPLRQSPLDTKPRKPVTMYRMEPEDCYTMGEISKKFHLMTAPCMLIYENTQYRPGKSVIMCMLTRNQ